MTATEAGTPKHVPANMQSRQQPPLKHLLVSFLRLGVTAFGGPSMVPYMRRVTVDRKHWLDSESFNRGVALCQMIPGATAMQTAAYVGLKTRGVRGAVVSFVGFGFPAFVLMMVFGALYAATHNLPGVVSAFSGLQAVIVAIVANAALTFGRTTLKERNAFIIAGIAAALFGIRVNPVFVILVAALCGLALLRPAPPESHGPSSAQRTAPHTRALLLIGAVSAAGFISLFFLNRTLFDLAALMARIDLFAFGGGFASVPLMFHEIVKVRNWMDGPTFMNGIVLGQITPGPIVITATFIGYMLAGPLGGLIATASVFLPSFTMVIAVAPYFERLRASDRFTSVISGALCSFVGLLLTVTVRFALNVHWDLSHVLLAACAVVALMLRVDILWVVTAGTIVSVLLFR